MDTAKKTVGVLFGGKSVEHRISLRSAKNIFQNIDRNDFDVLAIGIDAQGNWYIEDFSNEHDLLVERPQSYVEAHKVGLVLDNHPHRFIDLSTQERIPLDVLFPVLHGTFGEDGSVQGLLQVANVPYVGCGVLSSAVSMDKVVSKRLLNEANVPTALHLAFDYTQRASITFQNVVDRLGLPLIAKPANLGSSVGVSKIDTQEAFDQAVEEVFKYDNQLIFEEFIEGREVECSILGDLDPRASLPGEIELNKEKYDFYSFEAKYEDKDAVILHMPARLNEQDTAMVQEVSKLAYKALNCTGLARVDLFIADDGRVLANEINTLPGFTNASMFPQLWGISGIPYTELLSLLLEDALQRAQKTARLETSY